MRRKRAALITLLLLLLLVGGAGLWLHVQQRQHTRNRELIAALIHGDDKQALVLVNAGADPNTHYEPTPAPSLLDLVKQFFHRSPLPMNDSPTAFMIACGANWNDRAHLTEGKGPDTSQLVQAMLGHDAMVNVQDKHGATPLLWAVYDNRRNVVGVLLEHGAEVNAKDKQATTPLILAAGVGVEPDVVRLLLQHGAEVNTTDSYGLTALYRAVLHSVFSTHGRRYPSVPNNTIQQLLAHGADPNVTAKPGETPLKLAQGMQRPDIVALLKQAGAKDEGKHP